MAYDPNNPEALSLSDLKAMYEDTFGCTESEQVMREYFEGTDMSPRRKVRRSASRQVHRPKTQKAPNWYQCWLTTSQVAALFGRSDKTIARYVDQGLLRAGRTQGGHRKIAFGDLWPILNEIFRSNPRVTRTFLKRMRRLRQQAVKRR